MLMETWKYVNGDLEICQWRPENMLMETWKYYSKKTLLHILYLKKRNRRDMVVEMKVQYCREELWDSFYTDETILLNTFFETFFYKS